MLKTLSLPDVKIVRAVIVRALLLAMLASMIGMSAVRMTKAADPMSIPPCFDIIGQGKEVLVNGVPNSGVTIFDPIAGNPLYMYEACAVDPDGNPTVGDFEIQGWAWNDNLGWISFYCPSGAGATNLGIACSNGSYTGGYGVTIDPATGAFSGYAWGDNAGWISFDNPGFSQVKVDSTNPECQGYVYSTTLPDPSCPVQTKAQTAAWSDNVGWMDFDGILLPWYSLIVEIDDTTLWVTFLTDGGEDPSQVDLTDAPYANGTDKYTLRLHVQDKKGNMVNPGGRYTVTATPQWTIDTVKKNQTHPVYTLTASCDGDPQHAVSKPCVSTDMLSTGGGNYDGILTSVAPTSNMNGWDESPTDGAIDFSYENFTIPSSFATSPVQPNQLLLQDVLVSIIDVDAGGACVYGIGGACAGKTRVPTFAGPGTPELKFRPQTNISSLKGPVDGDHPTGNDEYIAISSGTPTTFPVSASSAGPGNVTFYAGIDPAASSDYGFIFDTDADGILTYPPVGDTPTSSSLATALPASLSAGVGVTPDTPIPAYVPGLYMYSVVDEGSGVLYYSNKLPKTLGSVSILPVAVLRGNVYSSGATTTTTSVQAVRSLGDVSTNILRDTIFRNVSKIIAGGTTPSGDAVLTGATAPDDYNWDPSNANFVGLLPDEADLPRVYYVNNGNLVLESLLWCGERTFIVTGGNVYIKSNLFMTTIIDLYCGGVKPKLGIIALKDLASSPLVQQQQGHIYIDPSVTNIEANIFADGSVFSAPVASAAPFVPTNALGEPTFAAAVIDQENALKYTQLFIQGSMASQNTVGGASLALPIIGTGEVASASDKLLQSRMYDLNYLRYYTGILQRNAGGVPIRGDGYIPTSESEIELTHPDGTPWTAYESPEGYIYSPVTEELAGYINAEGLDEQFDLGATYIYFDPPTATLPGFGFEASGEQRQLPQ